MIPLNCLTLFLESGKRFRLASGETFDQLRQPQEDSKSSTAPAVSHSGKRSSTTLEARSGSRKKRGTGSR